jgi:hypothetical protein
MMQVYSTPRRGDYVAILPTLGAPPEKVVAIAKVICVSISLIELDNGNLYLVANGQGMNVANYIELAKEEHHVALSKRIQMA